MDDENADSLIDAIKLGQVDRVEAILAAAPERVNERSAAGVSALLWSVYYGHQAITRLLLDRPELELDLFGAAACGLTAAVDRILAADPEQVNAVAPDGFQPLGLASFFGHLSTARLLLAQGASVNAASRNSQRVTPLHAAAAGRHLEIARLLLAQGAAANARQTGGYTPLHSAAQNGQRALVSLLLSYGADKKARTDGGETAWELAAAAGHQALRDLLT